MLAHDAAPMVFDGRVIVGKVHIKEDFFVGAGAVILPGVTVGPRAVVGANAVVTRSVPENSIVAGSPAKVIGRVDEWLLRGAGEEGGARVWISSGCAGVVPTEQEVEALAGVVKGVSQSL